jgi:hypothetical protein
MDESYGRTKEFQTILEIAESLRAELGTGVDVHPGVATVEPGQANRAFRVAAVGSGGRLGRRGDDLARTGAGSRGRLGCLLGTRSRIGYP